MIQILLLIIIFIFIMIVEILVRPFIRHAESNWQPGSSKLSFSSSVYHYSDLVPQKK